MITIFGTTYFTIGAGLVALVLAAPFLLWFSVWLLRPNIEGKPRRVRWLAVGGTTLALLSLTAVGLFWDVYLIGQGAKELCAETGLVVYRQASVDGFAGSAAIERWASHGFRFVETDRLGTKHRYQIINGEPRKHRIDILSANYRLDLVDGTTEPGNMQANRRIVRRGGRIVQIDSGETISELTKFTIHYGWFDTALINLAGFVANPRVCGRNRDQRINYTDPELDVEDLVLATLEPK